MVQQPSTLLRILVFLLLILGWSITLFLAVRALERLRCLPGWGNFLGDIPTATCRHWRGSASLFSAIELPRFATPRPENRISPTAQLAQPTLRPTQTMQPTALPVWVELLITTASRSENRISPTAYRSQPTLRPTQAAQPAVLRCRDSLPTRLRVGATGRTHHEFNVRLRDAPAGEAGVRLAPNTRFEVIGAARCARLGNNELLWWQVRLTSGSARGQVGWMAESGPNDSGKMLYNLYPN